MKLYQIDMYLYKVSNRKTWKVYSGEGNEIDHGKYDDMVKKYGDEKVVMLNMSAPYIGLRRNEKEIQEDLDFKKWVKEIAEQA